MRTFIILIMLLWALPVMSQTMTLPSTLTKAEMAELLGEDPLGDVSVVFQYTKCDLSEWEAALQEALELLGMLPGPYVTVTDTLEVQSPPTSAERLKTDAYQSTQRAERLESLLETYNRCKE